LSAEIASMMVALTCRQRPRLSGSRVIEAIDFAMCRCLPFAKRVLSRAADLWVQALLEQRQRFQYLFFPGG